MKKLIKILITGILILLAICVVKIILNPEQRIKNFINQNKTDLTTIAESYLNSDTAIKTYKGITIEQVFRGENDIVQFYYGGVGIVPASKYYGFYYSPNDLPAVYQNANYNLSFVSNNEWKWTDGTDNGGITKKLMKNWFYYEAWF